MPGRDLSAELYGATPASSSPAQANSGGRDLSTELYGETSQPPSAGSRVRAVATGINKGFYSDLLGLPVDTVANVLDLAKAGIGTAYQAVSGKTAPDWTLPMDRRQVAGTGDWIAGRLNDAGLGTAINNPNPQDATSRILYSGGRVAGASIVPNAKAPISLGQNLVNMSKGAISGAIGGAVGEVAPDWAGVASMLPQATGVAAAGATKAVIRGGEQGRQVMSQRLQDLKNGGINEPSVGLASGNSLVLGLENLLSQTPGSVGVYQAAKDKNLAGMKARTDALRDSISTDFGPVATGSAIQTALKGGFRNRVNATTRALNDRVSDEVGPNLYTLPESALATSRGMSAINPAAPATSAALQNKRITGIASDLGSDVLGTPIPGNPLMNAPTRYMRADGQIMDAPPGIPFDTLKGLRTSIGEEANSPLILGTPEGAQFKRLYGAMSQDMRQATNTADRQNTGVDVGPLLPSQQPATMALNRANTFYSRASTRAEDLNGIANRDTPEGAYGTVVNSLNSGPSLYEKLRGALDPSTRQKLVGSIVDQLGTAKPGQQNAAGDEWSPRTFLTNYAKLYQNGGGDALFKRLPGGQKQADQLADIAKASGMTGDASKVWANPSGTSAAMVARGTLGALGGGAVFAPFLAAKVGSGLLLANQVSKRLLLNPNFVSWLAKAPGMSPTELQSSILRLNANAKLWGDKQVQKDVGAYVEAVNGSQSSD